LSSSPTRRRRAAAGLAALALVAGVATTIATTQTASAAPAPGTATYLVQLADAPAATYTGGVAGYAGTKPAAGVKINATAPNVARYRGYLAQRQDGVLRAAASARAFHRYSVTFNGFAATMSTVDAAKLARTAGVKAVVKDEKLTLDTTRTPEFLGLTKKGGIWDQLGGPKRDAGAGVVVADLDSGLWPENPSVQPLRNPKPVRQFAGTCQTGEQWTAADCSTKIVGARYYTAGVTASIGDIKTAFPYEFISARDADGHGTHTATTAAGNYNVPVTVAGEPFGNASGMAPNARLAVYKICWGRGEANAGCFTSDSVQAIEDATTDGADVINFSISGSLTSSVDAVEAAFFGAAQAGVFVSTSAGNDGPGASTVAHNSPWEMSVAAGTLDRANTKSVTLGNGQTFTGVGLGAAVPTAPIALASTVGLPGQPAQNVALCFLNSLDPAKVAGKIIVCDRGVNDRVEKSAEVLRAGGVGMVMTNTSPNSLNADIHAVPTVHVDEVAGAAIKAYVSGTASPTASLSAGVAKLGVEAPQVAAFSSRGPALAGEGDLLKPDILAPGVDVIAGFSPANNGRDYDFLSGTSMSSPHIAGLGALLIQKHPDWSPMMVKSALLTTASVLDNKGKPITNDSGDVANAFDYGSGQVNVNGAADPGLVYDSNSTDWVRWLCGSGQLAATSSACSLLGRIDPSDLNQPNIAIGALAGKQTVTRTVTGVSSKGSSNWTPRIVAPAGVSVTVSPKQLKVRKGGTATYKLTFTRTSATFDEYGFGSLTWTNGKYAVRSQLVVQPVAAAAPAQVTGTGVSGSTAITVTPGFTGTLTSTVSGLVGADTRTPTLQPAGPGFDPAAPAESARTSKQTFTVPAGTQLAQFSTFAADFAAGTDVDLFVYQNGELVGQSAGGTAEETIRLDQPAAGAYDLYVVLFGVPQGTTSLPVPTYGWSLGSAAAGNLTVTPASTPATAGTPVTLTAAWSGLTAGTRYLGRIAYGDGTATAGGTLVRVDA
jgi:subtilisin family serine protease